MKWLKILIVNVAEIRQPKTKKNKQTLANRYFIMYFEVL